ncbi:hypothetical protein C2E20_2389 [Micractinium conductrix]|uniref:Uncharacterized protein n=1 Tax=Micractinium conductrix TaxID=554055 RepID=A0A2P6VKA7_9CHLO|nr:hypothetical protein C2E20_2389 [Micractinium conductrix]|eukprot:PSC74529.1 hypothetical protein C2E20_2389 [Micractinium conductrix]
MHDLYTDSHGKCFCAQHRREVCHECCCDHRLTNWLTKLGSWTDAQSEALNDKMDRLQEVEHRAMLAQWRAEGHAEPLTLRRWRRLPLQRGSVAEAATAVSAAAAEGAGAAAAGSGGAGAVEASAAAGGNGGGGGGSGKAELVSWKQLAALGGRPAEGKLLELRIVSQPVPFLRHTFEGKDHRGEVLRVACYSDEAPQGLALGRVFRWRSPRFHQFMDGSSGARIEDEDVGNITVADNLMAARTHQPAPAVAMFKRFLTLLMVALFVMLAVVAPMAAADGPRRALQGKPTDIPPKWGNKCQKICKEAGCPPEAILDCTVACVDYSQTVGAGYTPTCGPSRK